MSTTRPWSQGKKHTLRIVILAKTLAYFFRVYSSQWSISMLVSLVFFYFFSLIRSKGSLGDVGPSLAQTGRGPASWATWLDDYFVRVYSPSLSIKMVNCKETVVLNHIFPSPRWAAVKGSQVSPYTKCWSWGPSSHALLNYTVATCWKIRVTPCEVQ